MTLQDLSPRELSVLQQIAKGKERRQIAACNGVSPETVKTQSKWVLVKLGAVNRPHAVAIGYQRGILP